MKIKWTQDDAWVLQSLRLSTEDNSGVTISRLLRVGDFINKDIINIEILRLTISKLIQSDLIYLERDKIFMTEKCLNLISTYCSSKQIHKYRDQLLKMLETIDSIIYEEIDISFLTQDYYNKAYNDYRDSFK